MQVCAGKIKFLPVFQTVFPQSLVKTAAAIHLAVVFLTAVHISQVSVALFLQISNRSEYPLFVVDANAVYLPVGQVCVHEYGRKP